MKKLALHWQILIGMLLGVILGYIMTLINGGVDFVAAWIKPVGTVFINLLKLIAVPLIIASLIKGISDLKDISKFKRMGGRTVVIYIATTVVAIIIGLTLVNVFQPGSGITQDTIDKLTETYAGNSKISERISEASKQKEAGPLQFLVDMVPQNVVKAMSDNRMMLQVIFFSILLGICMLLVPEKESKPLKKFFDSLNSVILKMVDIIMLMAPIAVLALLANVIVSADDPDILLALLKYASVVVIGLLLMVVVYLLLIGIYTKKSPFWFLKQISPAQLLAFSTSSSAATLPVTMERVEEHVGVFIMQVLWPEGLTFSNQISIILTALLASIGSAAVPGAGMVMLVIVLETVGFPSDRLPIGLALIFAMDRPLDMLRTTINVTGDATVAFTKPLISITSYKVINPVTDWSRHN